MVEYRTLGGRGGETFVRVSKDKQKEAVKFLLDNAFTTPTKLLNPGIVNQFTFTGATSTVTTQLRGLLVRRLSQARLERRSARQRREALGPIDPLGRREARDKNASESAKVPNQQDVNAAKKAAQSAAPPVTPSAAPAPPSPAKATPPAAPAPAPATPSAPAKPAAAVAPAPASPSPAPVAGKLQAPLDDAARRKLRLVDDFALGRAAQSPLERGKRQTLEVERLISGWLAEQ